MYRTVLWPIGARKCILKLPGTKLLNVLPSYIKKSGSINIFKQHLRNYLIANIEYNEIISIINCADVILVVDITDPILYSERHKLCTCIFMS